MAEITKIVEQLDNECKELIAVAGRYVLAYWHQDGTYVSWRYQYNSNTGKYEFGFGSYTVATFNNNNTAVELEKFAARIKGA
jgi:hypothetical protein